MVVSRVAVIGLRPVHSGHVPLAVGLILLPKHRQQCGDVMLVTVAIPPSAQQQVPVAVIATSPPEGGMKPKDAWQITL